MTRPRRSSVGSLVALGAGGLVMLLILGLVLLLGGREALVPHRGGPTPAGDPTPAGQDACFDKSSGGGGGTPLPNPSPGPRYPRVQGRVGREAPFTVSGTGNAEAGYTRNESVPTVLEFDCPDCQGPVQVYDYIGRAMVLQGESTGQPVSTRWLIDTEPKRTTGIPRGLGNSVLVTAQGHWRLVLRSARDLRPSTRAVHGQGPQVLAVASPRARFSLDPLNSKDKLIIEAYDLTGRLRASACIGRRETREIPLNGAQLVIVYAKGEWTLEPL